MEAHPSPDPSALLVTLQLADSAFPSGFYTLSHGLEGFAQAGAVDAASLGGLLADLLRHGVGPSDATALALAHEAAGRGDWDRVVQVDVRLHATKLCQELRAAAARTGRQLLGMAGEVFDRPEIGTYAAAVARHEAPGTQAVALGVVSAAMAVPRHQAVAADLSAFCVSWLGAALRLRLADHRSAQTVLHGTAAVITEVTGEALHRGLADLGGCVPVVDVMSGRHERAEARLFAS